MTGSEQSGDRIAREDLLLEDAADAREMAYAPHSGHAVGAVLLTADGDRYSGANIEVSGRSTSVHAEMMAVFQAVLNGAMEWDAIACTERPCAMCAHTLAEWAGDDLRVITPDLDAPLSSFLGESYRPGDHE